MAVVSCRAAEPTRGPRASSLRVIGGTGPSIVAPGRVAYGTNTTVLPVQDFLRTNSSLRVDGLVDITWGFAGTTEEVRVVGGILTHRAEPRATLGPDRVATPTELVGEQILLSATPVLGSALGSPSADGLIPFGGTLEPPGPITPFDNYSAILRRETFTLTSTSVRWQESTPDPSTGATYPVLVISTEYALDIDEADVASTLFDVRPGTVSYEHGIAFRPCRGGRCLTAGPLFDAYRTVLTRDGEDAVAPDLGLELIHQTRLSSLSQPVDFDPACILTLLTVPLPVSLIAFITNELGVPLVATDPISAAISCGRLRMVVEERLHGVLNDLTGTLDTLGDLLVNPPTFRTDLETVLSAAYDTNGDGQMTNAEVNAALVNLGFGPAAALAAAVGLTAGCASPPVLSSFCPMNAITSELTLEGSLAADGARPADPAPASLGEADGTFTDRTYEMFSRGTLADVRPTSVRLDLRVLRGICESGDAPPNFALLCGACSGATAPAAFCDAGRLRDYALDPTGAAAFTVPPGVVTPFAVPRVPGIARILEVAPLFASTLRRFLVNGTAPGVRFDGASWDPSFDGGTGRARFTYIIDPDFDGFDTSVDNCPDVANPAQADSTEGAEPDGVGDACDVCPDSAGGASARDCDCDQDGDGCNNDAPFGPPLVCELLPGRVYDRTPGVARSGDLDGDAILDDCDADTDGDAVPDAVDNCPRGDGDSVYEPGIDDEASQTDSGGVPARGDVCDLLCPAPGEPGCSLPAGEGDERVPPGALPFPGFLPDDGCFDRDCGIGIVSICGDLSLPACLADPIGFAGVDLVGQPTLSFGLQSGASSFARLPDLDGDEIPDFLLGAPQATGGCTPNGCVNDVGEVLLISGATGEPIDRLSFGEPGAAFGASVTRSGSMLAIGAPLSRDSNGIATGAVHLFDTGSGSLVFVASIYGQVAGERFGALVAPYTTKRGRAQLLIGGPGAGSVTRYDVERSVVRRFLIGSSFEMATLLSVREGDVRHGHVGPMRIVVGAPSARSAAGAVLVFDGRGRRRDVIYGRPGERFGTAIVRAEGSPDELWVGAPGHGGGRGAIVRMSLRGRREDTLVWAGRALGTSLTTTSDFDGDREPDLLVGFELDARAATLLIGAFDRPRGCRR